MDVLQFIIELVLGLLILAFIIHWTLLAFGSTKGLLTKNIPLIELIFVFLLVPSYLPLILKVL